MLCHSLGDGDLLGRECLYQYSSYSGPQIYISKMQYEHHYRILSHSTHTIFYYYFVGPTVHMMISTTTTTVYLLIFPVQVRSLCRLVFPFPFPFRESQSYQLDPTSFTRWTFTASSSHLLQLHFPPLRLPAHRQPQRILSCRASQFITLPPGPLLNYGRLQHYLTTPLSTL